jgi:hypothetical protein
MVDVVLYAKGTPLRVVVPTDGRPLQPLDDQNVIVVKLGVPFPENVKTLITSKYAQLISSRKYPMLRRWAYIASGGISCLLRH